jgi:hypothetical protein
VTGLSDGSSCMRVTWLTGCSFDQYVALDGEKRPILRLRSWIAARVIHEEPEILAFECVALDGRVRCSLAMQY